MHVYNRSQKTQLESKRTEICECLKQQLEILHVRLTVEWKSSLLSCITGVIPRYIQRRQDKILSMYSKQEKAMDILKVSAAIHCSGSHTKSVLSSSKHSLVQGKLVDRLAKSGNSSGEQVLQEHLLYNKQLMESMERSATPIMLLTPIK